MTRTPVNRTAARLAFALALACSFPAIAEDDISKVNGSIETSAGQRYGDLETVNGAVRVAENVQARDASTVNGSIHVESGARVDSLETDNGAIRLARDVQEGDPDSTLWLYRTLLAARRDLNLGAGELTWLSGYPDDVLAFSNGDLTVVANLGAEPVALPAGTLIAASDAFEGGLLPVDTTVWLAAG